MSEPVDPPDDPDEWTHEQWLEWLAAGDDASPADAAPRRPRAMSSTGGAVLGAAMLGMQQAIFGEVDKPEIVYEIEADGPDDGPRVDLDPDDPSSSEVVIPKPR